MSCVKTHLQHTLTKIMGAFVCVALMVMMFNAVSVKAAEEQLKDIGDGYIVIEDKGAVMYDAQGNAVETLNGYSLSDLGINYDPSMYTLTLDNVKMKTSTNCMFMNDCEHTIVINLVGDNVLANEMDGGLIFAFYFDDFSYIQVVFQGTGTLNVPTCAGALWTNANTVFNGTKLTVNASSNALQCEAGYLTITNGADVSIDAAQYGIMFGNKNSAEELTIDSDSVFTVHSGFSGIYALGQSTLIMKDSVVTATSENKNWFSGVIKAENIVIDNATINIDCQADGIFGNRIDIKDATFNLRTEYNAIKTSWEWTSDTYIKAQDSVFNAESKSNIISGDGNKYLDHCDINVKGENTGTIIFANRENGTVDISNCNIAVETTFVLTQTYNFIWRNGGSLTANTTFKALIVENTLSIDDNCVVTSNDNAEAYSVVDPENYKKILNIKITCAHKKLTKIPEVAATTEADGLKEYYQCDCCNKYYLDADAQEEIKDFEAWKAGDGKLVRFSTGWKQAGGKWYYYNANGVMKTGWLKYKDSWYYMGTDGAMVTGWKQIKGVWYYFASSGIMVTGWKQIKGVWYYFDDGAMVTGWKQIKGVWYYFNDGAMVTGWKKIDSKWYYFDDGAMTTGWKQLRDVWYYFGSSGAMTTGWKQISNAWYCFDSDGAMITGWKQIDGKWYHFGNNGKMSASSKLYENGKVYEFDEDGVWIR